MQNWLIKQATTKPDKLALIYQEQHFNFKELFNKVRQAASGLVALKIEKNDRIAVLPSNTVNSYFVILALQQIGALPVLLNYRLSWSEISQQVKLAKVKLLLIDDDLQLNWSATKLLKITTLKLNQLFKVAAPKVTLKKEFALNEVASIMYTSGTTGQPRGVVQTFGNHFYSAIGSAFNLGLDPAELWLCALPLFHISGLSIMMRSLIYGMGVLLLPHFSTVMVNKALQTRPVTLMSVVPQMLQQLLREFPATGYQARFRGFLLGGGPIDLATLNQCRQLKLPVVQSYGMTETCSQVVALSFADAPQHIGSVGQPLFPMQLRLSQPDAEIQLKGPNIVTTYLDDPGSFQRQMTADGWFKTGDIGYFDQAGYLYVKGRKNEMIISGGENIFPQEIEKVYQNYGSITEFAVIGVPDPQWGQVPCAFFTANKRLNSKLLKAYGYQQLAHYKVPHYFYQLDQMPKTASQKIIRPALFKAFEKLKSC
ncbi:o-succinylbenzoate--CoA ligase [Liquorilactobacillus vini]|uniref:2-succinylbenzoate--CoA ligase n=2 Tax=Liquorilactobacillus vini TaxID=238015 RepID=A0A0R2BZV3_9LACO|nr:o-succinylbenzoate--CoA ligase [Liquorilactobacillus vini]KRM84785.1 Acyl-CoA synthetase (AMP-forming) AMP-acid ligase II [Liquorilactobacillus vini DSM 20605]